MRGLALISAMGVLWLAAAVPAAAQSHPGAQRPILTQAVGNGYILVGVTSGRLSFSGSQVISPTVHSGPERLSLRPDGDQTVIEYQFKVAEEEFSVEARGSQRVRIVHAVKDNGRAVRVEFDQMPGRPLSLQVDLDGRREVYRAPNVWHFLVAEKEACLVPLAGLLEWLRPGWNLSDKALQIEDELLRMAETEYQGRRRRWAGLVQQLADDRFWRREAADRELRAAGPAVVPYLERLDFQRLEAEQQARIMRILGALARDADEDSAPQAASLLLSEPAVWLALLARPDEPARRAAAAQLARLLNKPVAFDPAADPQTRKRQIEQLRAATAATEMPGRP